MTTELTPALGTPSIASGPTSSRPASPTTVAITLYFDTTLGQPIWYLPGTGWVNAAGAVV